MMIVFKRRTFLSALAQLLGISSILLVPEAAIGQSTAPVAKLEATRLSGPAPLAVMFDATGTTGVAGIDTFRELTYEFNFGDDKGLSWEHSGMPRNTQIGGPLAAHVFNEPGTYSVRLSVKAPDGGSSEDTLTVTVDDPASAFPGNQTICVSSTKSYAGCPAGAVQHPVLPRVFAGKRILLNRGEKFGVISIDRHHDKVVIGAYGIGAKPSVQQVFINAGNINGNFVDDLTIMDLNILDGIEHIGSGSRYLLYRNDLTNPGGNNAISIGGALEYFAERNPHLDFYYAKEIFIVDNTVIGQINHNGKPFLNLSAAGSRYAVLGNEFSHSEQHTVRISSLYKAVIAHNAIKGHTHGTEGGTGPSIRHVFKLHSAGILPHADSWSKTNGKWATSQVIVADNVLGDPDDNSQWISAVAPENNFAGSDQGIEDVIIERNKFVRGPYVNTDMWIVGRRITTRGNTRSDGGPLNFSIGIPPPTLPSDWVGPYFIK